MAAVVEPGDRLLARVAALREADRALVETRLGRQHTFVDLATRAGCRRDPKPIELTLAEPGARAPTPRISTAGTP